MWSASPSTLIIAEIFLNIFLQMWQVICLGVTESKKKEEGLYINKILIPYSKYCFSQDKQFLLMAKGIKPSIFNKSK